VRTANDHTGIDSGLAAMAADLTDECDRINRAIRQFGPKLEKYHREILRAAGGDDDLADELHDRYGTKKLGIKA